jgi:hypothetical protein
VILKHYTGGNIAQTKAAKGRYLKDLERAAEDKIRLTIKEIVGSTKAVREKRAAAIAEIRREMQNAIADARTKFDAQIEKLKAQADELRAELRSRKGGRKAAKSRAADQVLSTARERREEEEGRVENDLRHTRPELIPVWRRHKRGIKSTDLLTLTEAFMHWVHENPEAIAEERAIVATLADLDIACEQAKAEAGMGNKDAASWAASNCGREAKRVDQKPKGSAAARTPSLFKSGERPTTEPKKAAPDRRLRKAPKPTRGQGSLSVGRLGAASLVDTDPDQLPL